MLNQFIWNNYTQSEQGKNAIALFEIIDSFTIDEYLLTDDYFLSSEEIYEQSLTLLECSNFPNEENLTDQDTAEYWFNQLCTQGFTLDFEDGSQHFEPDFDWYLDYIVPISIWLYCIDDRFFKPYFFVHNFRLLQKITDNFGIELPELPKKSDKPARFNYYYQLCEAFYTFETENNLTPAQMCAFLYDFCPQYFSQPQLENNLALLPKPSQVWLVGANKVDFEWLDNPALQTKPHFGQGNLATKKGDIIIMYCLSPRSYIHSIWRASDNAIVDPFFHWYSHIYITNGKPITPVYLIELKNDPYFSQNSLVKKNFQGVNGFAWSAKDYEYFLSLIDKNGDDITKLPTLYSPEFANNVDLKNEREVELHLIEPLLIELGYQLSDWVRQLTVKMGRGEKVFPDYALLSNHKKGFEQASILIEAKFHIKNQKDFELAFRPVWSYGLRLGAKVLVIADKNEIWVFTQKNQSFDQTEFTHFYWKELSNSDIFQQLKNLFTC